MQAPMNSFITSYKKLISCLAIELHLPLTIQQNFHEHEYNDVPEMVINADDVINLFLLFSLTAQI